MLHLSTGFFPPDLLVHFPIYFCMKRSLICRGDNLITFDLDARIFIYGLEVKERSRGAHDHVLVERLIVHSNAGRYLWINLGSFTFFIICSWCRFLFAFFIT